uniref:Uncharacterized protein n=1 Tax=Magallana gigas TaxID=29159 RepID=A0A8W8JCF5_MAGGI
MRHRRPNLVKSFSTDPDVPEEEVTPMDNQIVQQLARGGAGLNGGPAPAIENLGIGPYQWNTECLRGDVEAGNATSFPQAIGLAAAFSKDLIFNVSKAAAIEVRAKHNDFVKRGIFSFTKVLGTQKT